jgi:hypothetical protein
MISISSRAAALAFAASLAFAGAAYAQTPAPAASPAPAAAAAPAAAPAAKTKKAQTPESIACYKQADDQNLHGKARKKFHHKCMKEAKAAAAPAAPASK